MTELRDSYGQIVLAAQEYDENWTPVADVWLWSEGNIWIASVEAHEAATWWDGADDEAPPFAWKREIADVPTTGFLRYRITHDLGWPVEVEVHADEWHRVRTVR